MKKFQVLQKSVRVLLACVHCDTPQSLRSMEGKSKHEGMMDSVLLSVHLQKREVGCSLIADYKTIHVCDDGSKILYHLHTCQYVMYAQSVPGLYIGLFMCTVLVIFDYYCRVCLSII